MYHRAGPRDSANESAAFVGRNIRGRGCQTALETDDLQRAPCYQRLNSASRVCDARLAPPCVYANGGAGKKCRASRDGRCYGPLVIIVTALHRMGTAGHLVDNLFEPNPPTWRAPDRRRGCRSARSFSKIREEPPRRPSDAEGDRFAWFFFRKMNRFYRADRCFPGFSVPRSRGGFIYRLSRLQPRVENLGRKKLRKLETIHKSYVNYRIELILKLARLF